MDDGTGGPMISIENSSVSEGDAGVVALDFDVTLSAATSGPVTVTYATSDDSAIAGADLIARRFAAQMPRTPFTVLRGRLGG